MVHVCVYQALARSAPCHAAFVELFNTTAHWAHREREDGLRTPVEVLRWVRGADVEQDVLQRALRHRQVERVVTLRGYVSVQRFYLYAERGLSRRPAFGAAKMRTGRREGNLRKLTSIPRRRRTDTTAQGQSPVDRGH